MGSADREEMRRELDPEPGTPHPTDPTLVWAVDGYLCGDGWTTRMPKNWLQQELDAAALSDMNFTKDRDAGDDGK